MAESNLTDIKLNLPESAAKTLDLLSESLYLTRGELLDRAVHRFMPEDPVLAAELIVSEIGAYIYGGRLDNYQRFVLYSGVISAIRLAVCNPPIEGCGLLEWFRLGADMLEKYIDNEKREKTIHKIPPQA